MGDLVDIIRIDGSRIDPGSGLPEVEEEEELLFQQTARRFGRRWKIDTDQKEQWINGKYCVMSVTFVYFIKDERLDGGRRLLWVVAFLITSFGKDSTRYEKKNGSMISTIARRSTTEERNLIDWHTLTTIKYSPLWKHTHSKAYGRTMRSFVQCRFIFVGSGGFAHLTPEIE